MKQEDVEQVIEKISDNVQYISRRAARRYFRAAAAEVQKNIVEADISKMALSKPATGTRLDVVDLSSFQDLAARFAAVDAILVQIWGRARLEWEYAISQKKEKPMRLTIRPPPKQKTTECQHT